MARGNRIRCWKARRRRRALRRRSSGRGAFAHLNLERAGCGLPFFTSGNSGKTKRRDSMAATDLQLWLFRHGETAWSLSGAHTSRTDIPLTDRGRARARKIRDYLQGKSFSMVLTSPMQRARETCEIAGLGDVAQIDNDLNEWNYGAYEGRTTKEIQQHIPDWSVWTSPIIDGESMAQVAERANRVIARAAAKGGHVALFAHAHVL